MGLRDTLSQNTIPANRRETIARKPGEGKWVRDKYNLEGGERTVALLDNIWGHPVN